MNKTMRDLITAGRHQSFQTGVRHCALLMGARKDLIESQILPECEKKWVELEEFLTEMRGENEDE